MQIGELIEKLKEFDPKLDAVVETVRGVSHIEEPVKGFESREVVVIRPE